MSIIQVNSELTYKAASPTHFLLNIAAAQNERQRLLREAITLTPAYDYALTELGDEGSRIIRFSGAEGEVHISYRAVVELDHGRDDPSDLEENAYADLPDEVLPYLYPSRYCESDKFGNFAANVFGGLQPGLSRVSAICDWIHDQLDYVAGSTNGSTGTCDVFIQRTGVCRDYAHMGITLCRALQIPARYVSGYAVGLEPPDFHGFFEAYLGSRWYLFDATRMAPKEGLVRIGTGRDAADAAFSNNIGEADLEKMEISARELGREISLADNESRRVVTTS